MAATQEGEAGGSQVQGLPELEKEYKAKPMN